jgi:predicted 3-demethylubiquinone-9 3-methyltransferase (glyoxalase superfamily)
MGSGLRSGMSKTGNLVRLLLERALRGRGERPGFVEDRIMIPTRLSFASLLIAAVSAIALHCDHAPAARKGDPAMAPKKITPFLWFDQNAEEAIRFYLSVFKDSKVLSESRSGGGAPGSKGALMSATFEVAGQELIALNGGPLYKFTEAISLFVNCETQAEIDDLWAKLTAGGEPGHCGWLKDKFGLSWQIVPAGLPGMLSDKDPARGKRVLEAMLKMSKLDLARLKQAYDTP